MLAEHEVLAQRILEASEEHRLALQVVKDEVEQASRAADEERLSLKCLVGLQNHRLRPQSRQSHLFFGRFWTFLIAF